MYLHSTAQAKTPPISRSYAKTFAPTASYLASLPDVMEATDVVAGMMQPVQQVGVSNFRLPLKFRTKNGKVVELATSVLGTVSLGANVRGIHMGRVVRIFYESRNSVFDFPVIGSILGKYRRRMKVGEARLKLSFAYPMLRASLRSRLSGYQYYDAALEATWDERAGLRRFMDFDFVYSSACPCSAELSEHARDVRGAYAVAHSQRSKARIRVELAAGATVSIEDLHSHCLNALRTETQVMVKRADEQAFAELNGAHLKFVEDAVRLIYVELAADRRIRDFQVACSHLESLHSHDAVSAVCKGVPGGFTGKVDSFRDLVC